MQQTTGAEGKALRLYGVLRDEHCKNRSLRSRRLEIAGERENGRARGRHARCEGASSPLACLLLARPFFLVPTTSKRLLRRLQKPQIARQSTNNTAIG